MRISALYRYPLKGFSPERLTRVSLGTGGHFPADRQFAIENGPSGFDAASPVHQPKIKFLMLMKQEAIARLHTRYDDETGELSFSEGGVELSRGAVGTSEGRERIEAFLESWLGAPNKRGPLHVLSAPEGFRFTDSSKGFVSLINLASIAELEKRLGAPVDPLRFRANIHIEGLEPWQEFDLTGSSFEAANGVRLRITKRIDRCAATAVDPATGLRDQPIVATLMAAYGHIDCGVYAEIEAGGPLAEGQRLTPCADPPRQALGF